MTGGVVTAVSVISISGVVSGVGVGDTPLALLILTCHASHHGLVPRLHLLCCATLDLPRDLCPRVAALRMQSQEYLVLMFLPLPVLNIRRKVAHPALAAGLACAALDEDGDVVPADFGRIAADESAGRRRHAVSGGGVVVAVATGTNLLYGLDQNLVFDFVPAALLQIGAEDFIPAVAALVGISLDAE